MYLCRLRVPNCATRRRYTIHKHVYATSIIVHASHSRKQRNSTTQQYPVILTRTTTENIPLSLVFVSFANSAKHCNPWCKWPGPRRTHITPSSRAPSPAAQETKTGKFEVGAISKSQKSAFFLKFVKGGPFRLFENPVCCKISKMLRGTLLGHLKNITIFWKNFRKTKIEIFEKVSVPKN